MWTKLKRQSMNPEIYVQQTVEANKLCEMLLSCAEQHSQCIHAHWETTVATVLGRHRGRMYSSPSSPYTIVNPSSRSNQRGCKSQIGVSPRLDAKHKADRNCKHGLCSLQLKKKKAQTNSHHVPSCTWPLIEWEVSFEKPS